MVSIVLHSVNLFGLATRKKGMKEKKWLMGEKVVVGGRGVVGGGEGEEEKKKKKPSSL